MVIQADVKIHGLAELAQQLPDNDIYELRVCFRREGDGAFVYAPQQVVRVVPPASQEGTE